MVVVTLTDCPSRLRGDLTKWMLEVNTGVYVGNFSGRVRDELWQRICDNIQQGRAVMIYSTNNEQHFSFRTHNSDWIPDDHEGVSLIHRSSRIRKSEQDTETDKLSTRSTAARMLLAQRKQRSKRRMNFDSFIVLDLETTGIYADKNEIIEIAALKVKDSSEILQFQSIVQIDGQVPKDIMKLTGITQTMLKKDGRPLEQVLQELIHFIGKESLVCYNAKFDKGFLEVALKKCGYKPISNQFIDVMALAKLRLKLDSYKLLSVAEHLLIDQKPSHRALQDCQVTLEVFNKLKKE